MESFGTLIAALRVGVDAQSFDVDTQKCYEQWLKHDEWSARSQALPLIVGVAPPDWSRYLDDHGLQATEAAAWPQFQHDVAIAHDSSSVSVEHLVACVRRGGVELPASFSRLYDFVRQTTLYATPANVAPLPDAAEPGGLPDETEIVLGAALSLVATMPDRCRDDHGFVEGEIVAKLILKAAARWFPLQPATMSEAAMAALINKWLE